LADAGRPWQKELVVTQSDSDFAHHGCAQNQ